jgi:hypothetical protein
MSNLDTIICNFTLNLRRSIMDPCSRCNLTQCVGCPIHENRMIKVIPVRDNTPTFDDDLEEDDEY